LSQSVKHAKINYGQYAGVIQLGISFAASRAGRFVHNAQRPLPTNKKGGCFNETTNFRRSSHRHDGRRRARRLKAEWNKVKAQARAEAKKVGKKM
jgi:hypothetical protein